MDKLEIICYYHKIFDVYYETLLYIFEAYRTELHSLTFGTSQIITIILNNLKLVHMSQLC